jgi:hypothetical protein
MDRNFREKLKEKEPKEKKVINKKRTPARKYVISDYQ